MTNHHDQMSVAPDPARAEELRQRLHAHLAGGPTVASVSITPADTDPDHGEGDLIMLETEDQPTSRDPMTPRRRSPGSWLLVAAAVAVVAVVGGLLVAAAGDDDDETQVPATAPAPTRPQDVLALENLVEIEPGAYFLDPDGDASTPLTVSYEVAADGWLSWPGAAKSYDTGHVIVSITTIGNVVRQGCEDHRPADPPVGPTVDDLATALSQLAPFEVSAPPSDVTRFGYPGKHLQLTVPALPFTGVGEDRLFNECQGDSLHSWFSDIDDASFYGYNGEAGRTEDFWILDVDGTRLVIITTSSPETPEPVLAEQQAIFDSIQIQP